MVRLIISFTYNNNNGSVKRVRGVSILMTWSTQIKSVTLPINITFLTNIDICTNQHNFYDQLMDSTEIVLAHTQSWWLYALIIHDQHFVIPQTIGRYSLTSDSNVNRERWPNFPDESFVIPLSFQFAQRFTKQWTYI